MADYRYKSEAFCSDGKMINNLNYMKFWALIIYPILSHIYPWQWPNIVLHLLYSICEERERERERTNNPKAQTMY